MVRSSLGRSIELSTIRTSTGSYGFYALPVADLLELTEWVPHQDLLAAGKLVEVKPDDTETEVVFCSHQWTSFDAPDPTMDQLKVLQSVIRKLMAGKTEVRSNGMLDAVYQYQMRSSGSDWAKALPKMCFWLDYFCMPQPGALIGKASDELKARLDTNNDGIVSQAELADAALEPGTRIQLYNSFPPLYDGAPAGFDPPFHDWETYGHTVLAKQTEVNVWSIATRKPTEDGGAQEIVQNVTLLPQDQNVRWRVIHATP